MKTRISPLFVPLPGRVAAVVAHPSGGNRAMGANLQTQILKTYENP
jgi:hypothetical protein